MKVTYERVIFEMLHNINETSSFGSKFKSIIGKFCSKLILLSIYRYNSIYMYKANRTGSNTIFCCHAIKSTNSESIDMNPKGKGEVR